ncbi:MAG: ribosome maturation factor RimP [Roseivirga sp.]|jgi:ribosome maturation factor RimP
MDIKDFVEKAALESLKDESYFIVDVLVKGLTSKAKILVLLDNDNGVNIDECAALSRAIGMKMELEEVFDDPFVLEVSSPGLDHPLKFKRQYQKNIGRELKFTMLDGTIEKGKLIEVGEESIKFEKEIKEKKKTTTELVEMAFDSIDKANVLVSFK